MSWYDRCIKLNTLYIEISGFCLCLNLAGFCFHLISYFPAFYFWILAVRNGQRDAMFADLED